MFEKKIDAVIEAVRYTTDGMVEVVRGYERRGPTYSDRVLMNRKELVERLKKKQRIMVGQRVPQMASTFDVKVPLRLSGAPGRELVLSGQKNGECDDLQGVPLF